MGKLQVGGGYIDYGNDSPRVTPQSQSSENRLRTQVSPLPTQQGCMGPGEHWKGGDDQKGSVLSLEKRNSIVHP